jgi:presenilin-like A22 family membrane protease
VKNPQEVFMKHNVKITILLLSMFLVTQFIGLYVIHYYYPQQIINGEIKNITAPALPYGLETPQITQPSDYTALFSVIIVSFVIAIVLLFLFTKFKMKFIIKTWFFIVIIIALGIFFNTVIPAFQYAPLIAVAIAIPLAAWKVYGKNFVVHNLTELLVYPGIAAVFVPILNVWTILILLLAISVYDIWAVWHSGIMQKMAKYQINELNIFSGFFVSYISKKLRDKIRKIKARSKDKKKKVKVKVNLAILGGGDVIFPIISAGVIMLKFPETFNKTHTALFGIPGLLPALFVSIGATLGLTYLFIFSQKKKFYPAMPFITAGILLGLIMSYLIL